MRCKLISFILTVVVSAVSAGTGIFSGNNAGIINSCTIGTVEEPTTEKILTEEENSQESDVVENDTKDNNTSESNTADKGDAESSAEQDNLPDNAADDNELNEETEENTTYASNDGSMSVGDSEESSSTEESGKTTNSSAEVETETTTKPQSCETTTKQHITIVGSNNSVNSGSGSSTGGSDGSSGNSSTGGSTSTSGSETTEVFNLVNQYRSENGLSKLAYRNDLQSVADLRAREIVTNFSHTRPNGTSCFTAVKEAGISYSAVGENIAYGQKSADAVMTAWMNSSGHRANILSSNYTGMAVGLYEQNGVKYWVQIFIR